MWELGATRLESWIYLCGWMKICIGGDFAACLMDRYCGQPDYCIVNLVGCIVPYFVGWQRQNKDIFTAGLEVCVPRPWLLSSQRSTLPPQYHHYTRTNDTNDTHDPAAKSMFIVPLRYEAMLGYDSILTFDLCLDYQCRCEFTDSVPPSEYPATVGGKYDGAGNQGLI